MRKLAKSPKLWRSEWSAERKTTKAITNGAKAILRIIRRAAGWGSTEVFLYVSHLGWYRQPDSRFVCIKQEHHRQVAAKLEELGFGLKVVPILASDSLDAEDLQVVERGAYFEHLDLNPLPKEADVWLWKITY